MRLVLVGKKRYRETKLTIERHRRLLCKDVRQITLSRLVYDVSQD
jgi:hypothetical protein